LAGRNTGADIASTATLETRTTFFSPQTLPRTHLFWMVIVALALRLLVMSFLYPERTDPARDHWRLGGEAGRIARSIAEGKGFSSPLFADTGPTSWLAPVYPYLLAGVFKVFGIYSTASAIAALSLDCLFSALTCISVFLIGKHCFGQRAGLWAGWIWAFFPFAVYFSADFIWHTALSTLLMSLVFLAALRMERNPNLRSWVLFGLLSGVGGLTDPIIMSVAPALGAWAWLRRYRSGGRWLAPGLAAVLAVSAVVSPWFVRNYRTFHKVIPFRSCLGLELYCGNNADSWHWGPPGYHPSDNDGEWQQYQQLKEIGYTEKKMQQGLAFISAHRGLYVVQTLRRIVYFWTGFWSFSHRYLAEEPDDPGNMLLSILTTVLALMGLWRAFRLRLPSAVPFLLAFLLFPITYYLTHPEDYYRRPLDPLFVVLAAFALLAWKHARKRRDVKVETEDLVVVDF
jgi:4-amino-4-deoxy-L-arabinose transferase-like glycosyltransferase